MKALYMEKRGSLTLEDRPIPARPKDRAMVKMLMCGFCGTDVSGYLGEADNYRYPLIIGHEAVGIITEIEPDNEKGLKVGDRVILEPYAHCGKCHACKIGRYNNCEKLCNTGVHQDGMFAEYHAHPVELIHKAPESMSDEVCCLVEPLAIAVNATRRINVQPGEYCAIAGAGMIGIGSALVCKAHGGIPIICDILDERLEYAKKVGIEYTCNCAKEDFAEYIKRVTGGDLADCYYEASGAPVMTQTMFKYIRTTGRIVLLGWSHATFEFDKDDIIRKEADVFGSRNAANCFPEAIALAGSGSFDADALVSTVIPIEQALATLKDMVEHPEHHLKVLVDFR